MNNLKKFATEADYSAATLSYPAVSWVVSGDTVHYDKTSGTTVNDKLMVVTNGDGNGEGDFVFYNCGSRNVDLDITGLTLDDTEVNPIACATESAFLDASVVHIAKYSLNTTECGEWFTGYLGIANASDIPTLDVLIPSQITAINHVPSNVGKLVIEATTPPSSELASSDMPAESIYVPDDSINTYKQTSPWSDVSTKIYPISDYSGNLPI